MIGETINDQSGASPGLFPSIAISESFQRQFKDSVQGYNCREYPSRELNLQHKENSP